ncbi:MAG: thiamine-phosphate kinase [Lentisphaerae bacterium]|nr:thiamine-phosphate kinase [Lentisphaerota bacterium]
MDTLGTWGERRLIDHLRQRLPAGPDVRCGIGDDTAVVRAEDKSGEDLLLTSDAVIAGRHFLPTDAPADVGHKAIGRALSDIAAMGGVPRWALIDLVAPPDTAVTVIEGLYDGAVRLAARHGLAIIGGDTTQSTTLELHVFAVGSVPRDAAVLRSGARPGDILLVTGALGGSRAGRHLRFAPRVAEGQWLRAWATAMIDLSDGLATDLRHIATRSGTGARLDAQAVPITPAAHGLTDAHTPLAHALTDGEDYELLFTVPAARLDAMLNAWRATWTIPCTPIGAITADTGHLRLRAADGVETDLLPNGFEHFRSP